MPRARAATLRVPGDHLTIQEAVGAASSGDTVLVAEGEYRITRPITFDGKSLIVRSEAGPDHTTIRMEPIPDDPDRASVFLFASQEKDAMVEGFTITGGRGTMISPDQSRRGGGVLCINGASAVITDCVLQGNTAIGSISSSGGGGVGVVYDSSVVVRRCFITDNFATGGAGILALSGEILIEGCHIARNSSALAGEGGSGGGLNFRSSASAMVVDTVLLGNAGGSGGGAFMDNSTGTFTFLRCSFLGNLATADAGGLYCGSGSATDVINCVFAGNRGSSFGGAIFVGDSAVLDVLNATIVQNSARIDNAGIECRNFSSTLGVRNSIVWRNLMGNVLCGERESVMTLVDPHFRRVGEFDFDRTRELSVFGRIAQLPDFILTLPDLRLRPDSRAIDAGTPGGAPEDDIEGTPRPCGAGVDVGAYELCLEAVDFLRGDANGDAHVDMSDGIWILSTLFRDGPPFPCERAADGNDDGEVGLVDATLIFEQQFLGGPSPAPPFPSCGMDPTPDGLPCDAPPPCP